MLDICWRQIDPTDDGGQFGDRGASYRTAIFVHNPEQEAAARESLQRLQESNRFSKPIVTRILPVSKFYPAEAIHQDFARKEALRYNADIAVQQRKTFQKRTWGDIP